MGPKWGVTLSDVHGAFEMLFARDLLGKTLKSQLVGVQDRSVLISEHGGYGKAFTLSQSNSSIFKMCRRRQRKIIPLRSLCWVVPNS